MTENRKTNLVKSQSSTRLDNRLEQWIALTLCVAVLAARTLEQFVHNRLISAEIFSSTLIPFVTIVFVVVGLIQMNGSPQWLRVQRTLRWSSLLLMVWIANGLPLDLLRITGLIPFPVDWSALATKALALASVVILARLVLARPVTLKSIHVTTWYGYAAFMLALPYPILRTCWALGGTLGLMRPGVAGIGFIPWLASFPWLLAAALSLFLVSKRRWLPRRLLVFAGWSATAIVALVGPVACWVLFSKLLNGEDMGMNGMAIWVPCLFYTSWLLWPLAIGAATRSFQLRSSVAANALGEYYSIDVKQNK
jgi:hypothetical protein